MLYLQAILISTTCLLALRCLPHVAEWIGAWVILQRMPGPPGGLMGHLKYFNTLGVGHHKTVCQWAREYGGIFRVRLANVNMVIVSDPLLVHSIVGRSAELEKSTSVFYDQFNVLAHEGEKSNLFTSKTDDWWRLIRKGLSPAFSANNLRKGFSEVQAVTNHVISAMRKARGAQLPLEKASLCVTLDVIGRVGFQKDFGSTASFEAAIEGKVPAPSGAGSSFWMERAWGRVSEELGLKLTASGEAHSDFRKRMQALLEEVKARGDPKANDQSIAGLLLNLRDPKTGERLPDDRLAAEFAVVYQGGTETTSLTTTWAIFMITQHPEVEQKVLAELDAHGLLVTPARPNPRPLEWDDLGKLTYTNSCIKESMRMVPALTGTSRMAEQDIMLGGYLIPRKTMIWCNLNAMFSSPEAWHEPDKYIPERWETCGAEYVQSTDGKAAAPGINVQVNATGDTHPASQAAEMMEDTAKDSEHRVKRFIPFSIGPRDCIGQNLAKVNYQTTVPMLLSQFSFKLAEEMGGYQGIRNAETIGVMPFTFRPAHGLKRLWLPRLECTGMLALRPAKGFQMHCIPRSQQAEGQAVAAS